MREVSQLNHSQIPGPVQAKRINRTIQEDIIFVDNHKECNIPSGSVIVGRKEGSLKILRPHDNTDNASHNENRIIWLTISKNKIDYKDHNTHETIVFRKENSREFFEKVDNLITNNPDMALGSLAEEVLLFDSNALSQDYPFIDGKEINSFSDKSNFSGKTPLAFNYSDLKIPAGSFCDGRFSYLPSKIIDGKPQNPVLFMDIMIPIENNAYNTAYISIQPKGSPAFTYDVFYCSANDVRQNPNQKISNLIKHYQISVDELGSQELNPEIIRGLSEYQMSLEASIKSIGQTDITQKSAFISPETSDHNAPELKRSPKTPIFRKFLSNTSGIFRILFIVTVALALGGTALSVSFLIVPTWMAFFAAALGISSLSTLTTVLLPGIILFAPSLLLITSLWRHTKDSNQNIATNQTIGANLQRLSIATGAITLLAAIVINTLFPELLLVTAIIGITASLTLFISSRILQGNKGILESSLKADTGKEMPSKAWGYLITFGGVVASLTLVGVTLALIGMPFFGTVAILLNPWLLFGTIILVIALFVGSRLLKNIEFDRRIKAIDEKMEAIKGPIMLDGDAAEVISFASQKAYLESYRQAIINRYSGTLLQNIFAVGACLILPGLALLAFIPLSPSIAFLLGAVLALGVSVNSAFVNRNSAQKSILSDPKATKMLQTKRWFNAGSRCLHALMSVAVLSIIAVNIPMLAAYLALTATLTFSIVGIVVLLSLLIINIMLKYFEYKKATEVASGLDATSLINSGNKPLEILERKKQDLLATIEKASIKVPNLPYNVIFSEDFTKDETMFKNQQDLGKEIREHTLKMNVVEFKLMEKIFEKLRNHDISEDTTYYDESDKKHKYYDYEQTVDSTKGTYRDIKTFYAKFVADLNEIYNNPNSTEDALNKVFDDCNDILLRNGINLHENLLEDLAPLITATKDYYLKQFLVRENNKKICTKQGYEPYDLKRNYVQDGHRIGANKIEFTQLPSLQDKENVLLTLKTNVLNSNRGIFIAIALAGLSVPAITFLITTLLNISLLSNPIGWVILGSAIAFTLVFTIATWISYKISITPKDSLSEPWNRFEATHPDQMYQVNKLGTLKVMTWKDLNSKALAVEIAVSDTRWLSGFTAMWRLLIILGFLGTKLKVWFATIGQRLVNFFIDKAQYGGEMLSRQIFNVAMPIIFGVGGVIVLSLGLLVIPSLGWLLVPVAITMIVIQIPVAVLNSYTKKKIEGEGQSYRAIILSALVPASLALLPLLGTIFSLAIMASSAVALGFTLTAVILYNVYKIEVKESRSKEKIQKYTARIALGVAIGLTVVAIALAGVELFVTSAVAFGFFSLFPLFLPLVVILAALALFITWRKVRKNYIRPKEDKDKFQNNQSRITHESLRSSVEEERVN